MGGSVASADAEKKAAEASSGLAKTEHVQGSRRCPTAAEISHCCWIQCARVVGNGGDGLGSARGHWRGINERASCNNLFLSWPEWWGSGRAFSFVLNGGVDAGTTCIHWRGIGRVRDNNLGAIRRDQRDKTEGWTSGMEHATIIEIRRWEVDNEGESPREVRCPSEPSGESIQEQFGSSACQFGGATEGTVSVALRWATGGTASKAERPELRRSNHNIPGQLSSACRGFGGWARIFLDATDPIGAKRSGAILGPKKGDSGANIGPKACSQRPRLTQQCSPGMGAAPASLNGPSRRRSCLPLKPSATRIMWVRNANSKSRAH